VDRSRVAAHPFLAGLPDEQLDELARVATERRFEPGDVLMSEGDFGHSLFLVEDGSARVTAHGELLSTLGPGDVAGELAVLSSGRRTASVEAQSPVTVLAFFKRDVWALERRAPDAAQRFRAAIDDRVR
jgi:CRP-like cAMP-binding protein